MRQTAIISPSYSDEIEIEQINERDLDRIDWIKSIPFIGFHLAALIGAFFVPFSYKLLGLCVGLYYFRMFFVTAGYHRYFSHRSYKTSRIFQFILAFFGTLNVQKGVLWWAANHRHHHRYSDMPEDTHSPIQKNFLWSHITWIMVDRFEKTQYNQIRDFTKYPELMWLNKNYLIPTIVAGLAFYFIGGWPVFYWGFLLSTVILWHGTFTVNSVAHLWGSRRYNTSDKSRNNPLIALITMGEGWHNNHHHYMSSARQGFFWWEIDFSYYILKLLSFFGIVWDLRQPPKHLQ